MGVNFSVGMAALVNLVERAGDALSGWDCDIVESHHVHKQDARVWECADVKVRRLPARGSRRAILACVPATLLVTIWCSLRACGERIELVHRATNRDVFARGALCVARRVVGRVPGCYRVRDLIM